MKVEDFTSVLKEAGRPLTPVEIVEMLRARGIECSKSKTPEASVAAFLYVNIKRLGDNSPFVKQPKKPIFSLNPLCVSPFAQEERQPALQVGSSDIPAEEVEAEPRRQGKDEFDLSPDEDKGLSFTDSAEAILKSQSQHEPMHYKRITELALARGILKSEGKTPDASLYAQILRENSSREKRAQRPRFICHGRGLIGLASWKSDKLEELIEQQNHKTKEELLRQIRSMDPCKFEELVTKVFVKMGFKEMQTTQYSKDGGIDVRGVLEVEGVINIRMAIQVKRQKNNVQRQVVDALRGCLETGERGVIVTSSEFSKQAIETSRDTTKSGVIDLISGPAFVNLMVEHEVGVHSNEYRILHIVPLEDPDEE